jgi:integrase/recombinase XerD
MSKETGKSRVLTSSEFKRVVKMQQTNKYAIRNICCLYISYFLGLRAKEIASLCISSFVDTSGNLKKEVLLKRKMTKNAVQRRCYLTNDKLKKVVTEYLEFRKKNNTYNLDAPLILSQKRFGFTPDTMQKLFGRMYRAVGLDGASSHSGRRTFATKLIENGVAITNVQKLLGHKNVQTTTLYIQENPMLLGKISAGMNM